MILNIFFLLYFAFLNLFIGNLVLRGKKGPFQDILSQFLFTSTFGIVVLTYSIIFLGILRLLYNYIIISLINLFFLIGIVDFIKNKQYTQFSSKIAVWRIEKKTCFLTGILVCIILFQFLLTSTPPYAKDALVYHLQVPKVFLAEHKITSIPGNIFSNFPLNTEMLYLFGLSFRNPIFPKIINFYFNILLALLIIIIVKRYADSNYGIMGAILWNLIPSAFFIATIAYVDIEVTFFVLIITFCLVLWIERKERFYLLASAIFAGYVIGIKYTSLIYYFALMIFLYLYIKRSKAETSDLKPFTFFILISASMGCIWYVKNIIYTGNPLFPFNYSLFGGKGWDSFRANLYHFYLGHFGSKKPLGVNRSIIDYILVPFNVSFQLNFSSSPFDGVIGPLLLFLVPCIFITDKKWKSSSMRKVYLYFTIFLLLGWILTTMQIRFLLPCLALLLTIMIISFYFIKSKFIKVFFSFLIVVSIIINSIVITRNYIKIDPFVYLINNKTYSFLEKNVTCYPTYETINTLLSPNDYIFLVYMRNYGFYMDIPFYSDSVYEDYTIKGYLKISPERLYDFLREESFTHLLINKKLFLDINPYSSDEEIANTNKLREKFRYFRGKYLQSIFEDQCAVLYRII